MLVELNVVEQRYRVVLEVLEDPLPVTEVAMRHGVSRQTVHTWLRRYRESGMAGLVDRSRRPPRCPHQISAEMERMVCDLRRHHPRWGPWCLVHELRRQRSVVLSLRQIVIYGHLAHCKHPRRKYQVIFKPVLRPRSTQRVCPSANAIAPARRARSRRNLLWHKTICIIRPHYGGV